MGVVTRKKHRQYPAITMVHQRNNRRRIKKNPRFICRQPLQRFDKSARIASARPLTGFGFAVYLPPSPLNDSNNQTCDLPQDPYLGIHHGRRYQKS
jgi:hypothetical protein